MCFVHTRVQIFSPPSSPSKSLQDGFKLSLFCLGTISVVLKYARAYAQNTGVFTSRQVGFMLPSRPHQDLQRTTLQALRRTHGCRKWLKLDLRRTHDGPKMAPRWPRIAPTSVSVESGLVYKNTHFVQQLSPPPQPLHKRSCNS